MKLILFGTSKHKGEYEGRAYDYAKIYTFAPMEQTDEKKGSAGVDMRCTPNVFDQLSKVSFDNGVVCEVTTELRALGGSNARETVVSVQPVAQK